jgi:hypothetical protein
MHEGCESGWLQTGVFGRIKKRNRGGAEGEKVTKRLQKFVERGAYGEILGRTAYTFDPNSLPQAAEGFDWNKVDAFSAAQEILNDPRITEIFKRQSAMDMPPWSRAEGEGEMKLRFLLILAVLFSKCIRSGCYASSRREQKTGN